MNKSKVLLRCNPHNGGYVLYSDDPNVSPFDMKQKLFFWHKESYYGTTLELVNFRGGGLSGIEVSALQLLEVLNLGFDAELIEHELGPELVPFRKAAPLIMDCLREGRFRPSFTKWRNGVMGWELIPQGEAEVQWKGLSAESGKNGTLHLEAWLDQLIPDLVKRNPAVREAWEHLLAGHPVLDIHNPEFKRASKGTETSSVYETDDDWLIAAGWKKDDCPFRMALRLVEPQNGESWTLETVLQDLEDPTRMVVAGNAVSLYSGEASAALEYSDAADGMQLENLELADMEGFAADTSLPPDWFPHLEQKWRKERNRWLRVAPWLAESSAVPKAGGMKAKDHTEPGGIRSRLSDQEAWEFLTDTSLRLAETGAHILLPAWWENVRKQGMKLKAKVRSSSTGSGLFGIDSILQFEWRLAIGDLQLTEEEFRKLAEQKRRLIQMNGQWVLLDPAMLEQIRSAMKRIGRKSGLSFREIMELHLLGGMELEPAGEGEDSAAGAPQEHGRVQLEVVLNEQLGEMLARLQNTSSLPMISPPDGLQGSLRKYQLEGVSWLAFLQQFGLGACLADDMGLGKTIQWIAYVLYMKQNGSLNSPALLICPTSVIGNWQMELERFAPELRVHLHYGSRRAKGDQFEGSIRGADVVITSYPLAHLDEPELTSAEWSTLCLDEAQNIKNAYTKQAGAIRKLQARHRIALTGTPVENRLTELWSIFDFANPGYLGTLPAFKRTYVRPVESGEQERIGQLQKLIRPFLLRRVKKDPAIQLDLPDKIEMKTYLPLTAEQGAAYESVIQSLFASLDDLSPMERRGRILSTLTRLKQICDHPALLANEADNTPFSPSRSTKLTRLAEMVEELRSEGDKCLIFTQFVEMGHILQKVLEKECGEPVLFLHGGVPKAKRDSMIALFQGGSNAENTEGMRKGRGKRGKESGIFILSLKAGGTGLNLTAANHVFHFDRWWNPAVENQATDRAFRIGQTRDVQVHKFITLGTLEERIDQMLDQKQGLSDSIVGSGENWITELSTAELRELFSLRRKWVED